MTTRQLRSVSEGEPVHKPGSRARHRRGRSVGRAAWFAAGLVVGIAVATAASVQAQLTEGKPPDWPRFASYLAAMENLVIDLAVDTERSAIGIAELNGRLAGLERRIKSLESKAAN